MKSKMTLISLIFLAFFIISAVSAQDNSTLELSNTPVMEKTFDAIQTTIDNANESDTIILQGTYSGDSKPITINKAITLRGSGDGAKLNGRLTTQILNIKADNVVLENIAFVSGTANDRFDPSSGGAIYCYADNLKVISCNFTKNSAQYGGAIAAEGNNVSIANCVFTGNTALYTGGAFQLNGNDNDVSNCIFKDNLAYHAGGSVAWVGSNGILSNSVFTNSITDLSLASQFGGAVVWIGSNGKLKKSIFANNTARTYGAAVYWRGIKGSLEYCIFANNTSGNDSAYWGSSDYVKFNYWGFNINSGDSFIRQKLLFDAGYASPQNWVNIEEFPDSINFTLNDGSKLLDFMPNYQFESYVLINNSFIFKKDTIIQASNLITYCLYNGKYFKITLVDENYNKLPSKICQIKLNGKTYEKKTDSNGAAKLQISLKSIGTYKISCIFPGDSRFNPISKSYKITVKKQKPTLAVKTKALKLKSKRKIIKVQLKDQFKNTNAKKTVKMTINKKTYSAKTNSKGIASFKVILKAKKTYKYSVKFNGNKYFSAISKKASVKVK